ncbi:8466_t:CDS:10 [Entrophospora sp. SA101]|nr:6858_t:CDS:10 [Entrophospora sp. SA101]CAJ0751085.1 8466_t:CDS:10 [Entrophospora sp. SA101]CAJ0830036.1 14662_t:CDS:10 [Entrophospora sp. SA101]
MFIVYNFERADDPTLGTWELYGLSGVSAMHMAVLSSTKILFIDKVEANELKQSDGLSAIAAEFDLTTKNVRAIDLATNTFCSAGSWYSNGSLISDGGGQPGNNFKDGGNTIRIYDPFVGTMYEKINFMTNYRWYPTMATMPDGRVMTMGGSKKATGPNRAEINSPSYEFFPTADGSPAVPLNFQFLVDTLPYNLYPFVHVIPNAELKNVAFVFANKKSILVDLDTTTTLKTYPDMPGVSPRVYPLTGTSVLLPLRPATNYAAEIMVCGGGTGATPLSPADASCGRLNLSVDTPAWVMDDFGGQARVMPDVVITSEGNLLFFNGGATGYAGFHKGKPENPLYICNDPVYAPSFYDVTAKTYKKLAPSTISRMYHSVASLLGDGRIIIAGSNPQPNIEVGSTYPTEPSILTVAGYNLNSVTLLAHYKQSLEITFKLTVTNFQQTLLTASIIHFGFVTHSQHMSQRYVELAITLVQPPATADSNVYKITVDMPPDQTIFPPAPSFLALLYDGMYIETLITPESEYRRRNLEHLYFAVEQSKDNQFENHSPFLNEPGTDVDLSDLVIRSD